MTTLNEELTVLIAKATVKGLRITTTKFFNEIGSVSITGLQDCSSFPMTAMDAVKLLGYHLK